MNLRNSKIINNILASRGRLPHIKKPMDGCDEEGGCGVTGFISSIPIRGHHIYEPSIQMHNRGNGKGGGIAAVGLLPEDVGVPKEILEDHYLLQVSYLDKKSIKEVESTNINNVFDIYKAQKIPTIKNYRDIGLEIMPPDVWQYFVRVKPGLLQKFIRKNNLQAMELRKAEDEFVFQNSVNLNNNYYASRGEKRAFVMSHGRNMMIIKIVGYAEQVTKYYCLEDFRAYGWIAHQRYPTRGRMWHPGGAHPFSGMHEALVHNGDFANYYSVCEYLNQYNIFPQFLTDTETSILLFDLFNRIFNYPLEYTIEALAPTSEHDFDCLPAKKRHVYRYIQSQHMVGSPDGPWFFIIARNDPFNDLMQLIGITDTSMLRPQVFALQERDEVQIGLICSEKQAIDATLQSISEEDPRFCPVADKYWNARGGSSTDGGAFTFTIKDSGRGDGSKVLITENKFGEIVKTPEGQLHFNVTSVHSKSDEPAKLSEDIERLFGSNDIQKLKQFCISEIKDNDYDYVKCLFNKIISLAKENDNKKAVAIDVLTHLNDRIFPTGNKKRSSLLQMIRDGLSDIFESVPNIGDNGGSTYAYIDFQTKDDLRPPLKGEKILIVNAKEFEHEGSNCDSRMANKAYMLGWKRFIFYGYKGQRFTGCGFGKNTDGVRFDVYGSSGDYLASGIDGMEIYVHGNAQDQLGQIMKRGKLVVFGDVGQTFLYGAKGGEVYVMGNAAGRPLINATGRPKVVINGTCLDYLAESFMAGDPLNGGGFAILNGIKFDDNGKVHDLEMPYPGSSLFSLASGGAIYIRDPKNKVLDEHLNGGEFTRLSKDDWELILPYLKENEKLFGISIDNDLLTVSGKKLPFNKVYRKVQSVKTVALGTSTD